MHTFGSLVQRELSSVCETEGVTPSTAIRRSPSLTREALLSSAYTAPQKCLPAKPAGITVLVIFRQVVAVSFNKVIAEMDDFINGKL